MRLLPTAAKEHFIMDTFKVLVLCWSFVWASILGGMSYTTLKFAEGEMALLQLIAAHPTQAWTVMPVFAFLPWALGVLLIGAGLEITRSIQAANRNWGYEKPKEENPQDRE